MRLQAAIAVVSLTLSQDIASSVEDGIDFEVMILRLAHPTYHFFFD